MLLNLSDSLIITNVSLYLYDACSLMNVFKGCKENLSLDSNPSTAIDAIIKNKKNPPAHSLFVTSVTTSQMEFFWNPQKPLG